MDVETLRLRHIADRADIVARPDASAARAGDPAIVEMLLDAGARVDAAVPGDGNALIAAAARNRIDVARLLIDRGADVDAIVPGDETPLINAAGAGHLEMTALLLDAGADPRLEVKVGRWFRADEVRSPIGQAERGGHDDVVDLLRSRGAER